MNKEKNYLYRILRGICWLLLKILYRPIVIGKENIPKEGPVIFAGNHINAIDPTIVMISTNRIVHYMAKDELFKGIHGLVFKQIGLIPVYRNKKNPAAVLQAERILENGGTVGIFPEGTRNRTQADLLPFKKGTIRIAQKTNTPIVPFALKGEYKLFRRGITLEFGKAINVNNIEKNEANEELREEVLELIRK